MSKRALLTAVGIYILLSTLPSAAYAEAPVVTPNKGTIGITFTITGSDFGAKKGTVFIGPRPCQVLAWSDTVIECLIKTPMEPGQYDIVLNPQGKRSPVTLPETFVISPPILDRPEGRPIFVQPGEVITVTGAFFGPDHGLNNVEIESPMGYMRPCHVLDWRMDSITFELPDRLPRLFRLMVENTVGTDVIYGWGTTIDLPPGSWDTTTDGLDPIECPVSCLGGGLRCQGRYCDDVSLLCRALGGTELSSDWTNWFSEEGADEDPPNNERVCPDNGFVTGLECRGSYCDDVRLQCTEYSDRPTVRTDQNCYWTWAITDYQVMEDWDAGKFLTPQSMGIAGARCILDYCDNMELYLCRADGGQVQTDFSAIAPRFAPRLRFDQSIIKDKKCFPSDPGDYYDQKQLLGDGFKAEDLCNLLYATISNNEVPIYYMVKEVGADTFVIRYWYFYAYQDECFPGQGDHDADWESVAVLIVNGQLKRVAFYQHAGWYSRNEGGFETVEGTHPVVYVGKNSHGSYHNDNPEGMGGCGYFDDFRNPDKIDYHMDTWNNITLLARGDDMPDWMNCMDQTDNPCFSSDVAHPIEQTGKLGLGGFGGCADHGCAYEIIPSIPLWSDLGQFNPFINVEYASFARRAVN